jgi:hypothetical protein
VDGWPGQALSAFMAPSRDRSCSAPPFAHNVNYESALNWARGSAGLERTVTVIAEPAAAEAPAPGKRSSRKSVVALAVCALAINGAAAIYTLPFDLPSPNISSLAALLSVRLRIAADSPWRACALRMEDVTSDVIAVCSESIFAISVESCGDIFFTSPRSCWADSMSFRAATIGSDFATDSPRRRRLEI